MAKIPARRKSAAPRGRPKVVHQFLIVLSGTDPLVWRRIQVPEAYSFWDPSWARFVADTAMNAAPIVVTAPSQWSSGANARARTPMGG